MKYIVDIKGEIEGDYEIIGKYEERPQGKWILCEDSYFSKCSICGDIWLNEKCWNYCSNCGAYMRSEDNGKK